MSDTTKKPMKDWVADRIKFLGALKDETTKFGTEAGIYLLRVPRRDMQYEIEHLLNFLRKVESDLALGGECIIEEHGKEHSTGRTAKSSDTDLEVSKPKRKSGISHRDRKVKDRA